MSDLISWNERYGVDQGEIDSHHKRIVQLINVLSAARIQRKDSEYLDKVLNGLSNYAEKDLARQEWLLERNYCPTLAAHKEEHEEFRSWLAGCFARAREVKTRRDLALEAMNYLKAWLNGHVIQSDKKNSYYLRKPSAA